MSIDACTAKADIFFLSAQRQVFDALKEYMAKSKDSTSKFFQILRMNRAGEHKGDIRSVSEIIEGVRIEYFSPYALESNGKAEWLV